MKIRQILASLLAAIASGSAGPTPAASSPARIIVHPLYPAEAILVPSGSPVRFRGFDRFGFAYFDGQFVLPGRFTYACSSDCEGPLDERFLRFDLIPDAAVAARLPRWRGRHQDMLVVIVRSDRLLRAIVGPRQRAKLRSGKIDEVRGRIALVVDEFNTGIECDGEVYSARFIAVDRPAMIDKIIPDGEFGC